MPIAYSYARFSSKAQASGDSLRRQLSAAIEYADEHGLTLNTDLQDHGLSGYSGANRVRGALASFLRRVKAQEIERGSYLLIDSVDRLSREELVRTTSMWLDIAQAGINIVTLSSGSVFTDKADAKDMILLVLEIERSNRESVEKGRKVRKAHAESKRKAREGKVWTRSGPSWLRFDEATERFAPITEKVAIVQRTFKMIEGGYGTSAIARVFNLEGVPTLKKSSKGWIDTTILKLARSRAVLGEYEPHTSLYREDGVRIRAKDGDAIAGYYGDPIIEASQFYRVQDILSERSRRKGRGANTREFNNLFVGMIRCDHCGGPVGVQKCRRVGRWAYFLRCKASERAACQGKARIAYEPFEKAVLKFVREWRIPSDGPKSDTAMQNLEGAKGEVAELEHKVANLIDQAEAGSKAILTRLAQRERELEGAQKRVRELEAKVRAMASEKPLASRQEALKGLLEKTGAVEGEELYAMRAAISAALRDVIQSIKFSGGDDPTRNLWLTLQMVGDDSMYGFFTGKLLRWERDANGRMKFAYAMWADYAL